MIKFEPLDEDVANPIYSNHELNILRLLSLDENIGLESPNISDLFSEFIKTPLYEDKDLYFFEISHKYEHKKLVTALAKLISFSTWNLNYNFDIGSYAYQENVTKTEGIIDILDTYIQEKYKIGYGDFSIWDLISPNPTDWEETKDLASGLRKIANILEGKNDTA